MNEIDFMNEAIKLAKLAYNENEIPVGAVIVKNNEIISKGYNQKEKYKNPLKHAEIIAIENACSFLNDWRLDDCTLYVTLEPCEMCLSIIKEARIKNIVIALNKKINKENSNLPNIIYSRSKYELESLNLLQSFFQKQRNK